MNAPEESKHIHSKINVFNMRPDQGNAAMSP